MLHPIKRANEFEAALHERYDLTGTRVAAIASFTVATALAGTLSADIMTLADHDRSLPVPAPAPIVLETSVRPPTLTEVIAPIRAKLLKDIKLEQVRASVPPRLNSAALLQANGNPLAANQLLIHQGVPPMTVPQLRATAHRLHFALPRTAEKQVQAQVSQWEENTPTNKIEPIKDPETKARGLMSGVSPAQEAQIRRRIVSVARGYLGTRETIPNRGPVIDRFTGNEPIAWCAAMASYVYNEAGVPLSGGKTLHAWYPDYRIVRTLINPHSPQITSMQSAFQTQGYEFRLGARHPEAGDVLMLRTSDGGHTMIAERMVDPTHVLAIGGNTGNAVAERVIDLQAPNFVAAGSLFAK